MANYTKIDISRHGAVSGRDNHTIVQNLINNNPGKKIIIPEGFICLSSKIIRPVSNTVLEINGTLSATDGVTRNLSADMLIGQNVAYVDNSDGVYQVGQYLVLCADNYPVGGSGFVERRLGQCSIVVEAYPDRVVLKDPIVPALLSKPTPDLLVSQNAKIGHNACLIFGYEVENVKVKGKGLIDGRYPTMHNVYPQSIDVDDPQYYLIEEIRAGNIILFSHCGDGMEIRGKSDDERLTVQEANLATCYITDTNNFRTRFVSTYHPFMKHWALGQIDRCIFEDFDVLDSYNEDGVTLHHFVTKCIFDRWSINGTRRIGFSVGSGAVGNLIRNGSITNSLTSLYAFVAGSQTNSSDNTVENVDINACDFGFVARRAQMILNNVTIRNIRTTGHCITIMGGCDLVFNGGGSYDTRTVGNPDRGTGILTDAPTAGESQSVAVFNDFEIVRTKKAFWNRGGTPTITLNNCVVNENQALGDIANPVFVHNGTTVNGAPYPLE